MKHKIGFNPLGRKPSHRKALHKNMVTSLLRYERITTTKTKAQAVRRTAERMITRAKLDSVHNRREIAKSIGDKAILAKLFTEIGPRFKEREGGYTRIIKLGFRQNDSAEMVILELVGNSESKEASGKDKKKKAAGKAGKSVPAAKKKSVSGKKELADKKPVENDEPVNESKSAAGKQEGSDAVVSSVETDPVPDMEQESESDSINGAEGAESDTGLDEKN